MVLLRDWRRLCLVATGMQDALCIDATRRCFADTRFFNCFYIRLMCSQLRVIEELSNCLQFTVLYLHSDVFRGSNWGHGSHIFGSGEGCMAGQAQNFPFTLLRGKRNLAPADPGNNESRR